MQRCITRLVLAQLAVLAAAAVVAGKVGAVPIVTLLAGDAKAHPGYCGLARLRYGGTTSRTLAEGLTLRQAALGPTYAVLDGRVDLLVDRVVSCPAGSHVAFLKKSISLPRDDTCGKCLLLKPNALSVRRPCRTRGGTLRRTVPRP